MNNITIKKKKRNADNFKERREFLNCRPAGNKDMRQRATRK
jgi:hypothetical protein